MGAVLEVALWLAAGLLLVLTLARLTIILTRTDYAGPPGRAANFVIDTVQSFYHLAATTRGPELDWIKYPGLGEVVAGAGSAAGAVAGAARRSRFSPRSRFEPGPGAPCAHCADGPCAACARAPGGGPAYAARSAPGPAFRRTPAPPAEDPLGRLAAYSRRVRAEELDGLAGAPPARPSDREHVPLAAPGLLATADDGPRLEWAGPAPAATFVPDHYALSL